MIKHISKCKKGIRAIVDPGCTHVWFDAKGHPIFELDNRTEGQLWERVFDTSREIPWRPAGASTLKAYDEIN